VSYYASHLRQQDLIEFGFEAGKVYYHRYTFITHGTYDSSQLCADPPGAWAEPDGAPC